MLTQLFSLASRRIKAAPRLVMDASEPLKSQLHSKLNEFSSLTRSLLEYINADKPPAYTNTTTGGANTVPVSTGAAVGSLKAGAGSESDTSLSSILDKLIERDKDIQELVETAIQMRSRQRDIDWYESQLEACKNEMVDLQNRLYDAEKLLELTVHQGKQKLESIEEAEHGSVSPEKLIHYAHKISQASTAVSPVGWQPSDPRRPYPQDIEMRAGILGRLSSTGKVTAEEADTRETDAVRERSTFGFVGMNQNNNQSIATVKEKTETSSSSYQQQAQFAEQEPMSEDTSFSSSDEGI